MQDEETCLTASIDEIKHPKQSSSEELTRACPTLKSIITVFLPCNQDGDDDGHW